MRLVVVLKHLLRKLISALPQPLRGFVERRVVQLRSSRALRPLYARMRLWHRVALLGAYVLLIAMVVLFLRDLGSRIRTRSLPAGSIAVTTNFSQYLVGDPVTFTVTNNYNSDVYITNNCPAEPLEVYRLDGDKWVHIHDKTDVSQCVSTNRQVRIPAHSTITGSFAPWKHLFDQPGSYRVSAYVDYYNSLPYSDFAVITKPDVPAIPALIPPKPPVVVAPAPSTPRSSSGSSSSNTGGSTSSGSSRQTKTITLSVGTIVVQYDATTVYVQSVTPASGYTYQGGGSGTRVQITFKSSRNETQIQLSVRNGQLVQRVEN